MSKNKQLGMKWFHFLIYFVLWFNAVLILIGSLPYFNGSIWESPATTYSQYPLLQLVDQLYGAALCLFAVFCFFTRSRLAKFKRGAPSLVYIFYIFGNIGLILIYNVATLFATNGINELIPLLTDPTLIGQIVGTVVMVILNKAYFKKRANLFVN